MTTNGKNYAVAEMGNFADLQNKEALGAKGKFFLGSALALTGCEVSMNSMPAGQFTPFVHSHKMNEEVYIIVRGKGKFFVDGDEFSIQEGSMIRVAPEGGRAIKADTDLQFICIQAAKGSLKQATMEDGVIVKTKASWM